MPTPTIPAGNLFMNATTYTGNGSTQTIINGPAGASFQPDLVWVKSRSAAFYHWLDDSVRGAGYALTSNTTDAETNLSAYFTSFASNGFNLAGGSNAFNASATTYIAWQWKAGGTAVSNTSGSITSSVSANTTSGFSVITYTGNGSAGATIGHGLGVTPSMVIVKTRSIVSPNYGWQVQHASLGATKFIVLNSTGAAITSTGMWNDTAPTSSVITLGNDWDVNKSGATYVAYCWTPIVGYSAIGKYTGNGNSIGPFVPTGFRPEFIMVKRSDSAADWQIIDTPRQPYNNSTNNQLRPNSTTTESTSGSYYIDIFSNGFIDMTGASTNWNTNTGTYIYMAFAENPFKYANAR